jgi:hypothetical protein
MDDTAAANTAQGNQYLQFGAHTCLSAVHQLVAKSIYLFFFSGFSPGMIQMVDWLALFKEGLS